MNSLRIKNALKNSWPIWTLGLVVLLLFVTNYIPGTFLTGWDNLHPEYNFSENIKRSIFAVWQEYFGPGLLGGMGHASDLIRQVVLLLFSFILPESLLRYFSTFSMLFIGSTGVYFLFRKCIPYYAEKKTIPFFAGLFYLLNVSTMQTFYAPFEAFVAHFAFLPWLLLASLQYFFHRNKKNLLFFILILFVTAPAAYIPTLFVTFMIALSICLLVIFLSKPRKYFIVSGAKTYFLIFLMNAFWLLPFLYFTVTNSSVNVNSKINQMATEIIYSQNKEFGDLFDVMLLKGFWFNNVDPNLQGNFTFMLVPWRNHLSNPLIIIIGLLLFTIIITGVVSASRRRQPVLTAFVVLFIFAVTMLAITTPPFAWLDVLFRKIPLFNQAFRFPFTKFSTLTALTYAIFFAIGVQSITNHLHKKLQKISINKLFAFSSTLFALLLVLMVFPAFQGHLLYEKERLVVPQEYFDLFTFFKQQDPNTRIADFPQVTFWGWNFYRWGYGGSGFLWYGIKQPILDRAFDVWSKTSENYYFEVSNAIYSKNKDLLVSILQKYQVNWLIVDKNIIYPPSSKALFTSEIEDLLQTIPQVKKVKQFGGINVYQVVLNTQPQNYVFAMQNLPSANSYSWGDRDQMYLDNKDYIITDDQFPANYYYPFRTVFSGKNQSDKTFTMVKTGSNIDFVKTIPPHKTIQVLHIPSFASSETILPVSIFLKRDASNKNTISFSFTTPEVNLNNQKLYENSLRFDLFGISNKISYPLTVIVNGQTKFTIQSSTSNTQLIGKTFLVLKANNTIIIQDSNGKAVAEQIIPGTSLRQLPLLAGQNITIQPNDQAETITIKMPIINDSYLGQTVLPTKQTSKICETYELFRKGTTSYTLSNTNTLQLLSKNTTGCESFYFPNTTHEQGYAIFVSAKNIKGQGLHFWVLNEDERYAPIATYLPEDRKESVSSLVLPPQEAYGNAYSLHFDNISIGNDETANELGSISIYPIAYNFLTSLVLTDNQSLQASNDTLLPNSISHPNESLYVLNNLSQIQKSNTTLVLSQSFDEGWKAYEVTSDKQQSISWFTEFFPFFFGKELKNHVMVNNWENGWLLNNYTPSATSNQLIIIYLPQYLEYTGFIVLLCIFVIVVYKLLKQKL